MDANFLLQIHHSKITMRPRLRKLNLLSSREDGEEENSGEGPSQNHIRNPDDLDLIYKEGERQLELLNDSDNAQADKLGIILGFIFVVVVQIGLTSDLADQPFHEPYAPVMFYSGLLLLGIAAVLGMWMFFIRRYPLGYDINKLLDYFNRKAEVDYYKEINDMKLHALSMQKAMNKKKALMLKIIIIFFSLGVLLVIIPRLGGW